MPKRLKFEDENKHPKIEKKDYHTMSMEDLVDDLEKLVENEKIQTIKSQVDTIRSEFSTKFSCFISRKKSRIYC